ncbi:site-specific integrase [Clostridiaceae bacterium HFYG-1003]|nr:site-specific integrase [Clostridiaceae bacterium HFYG-1003]
MKIRKPGEGSIYYDARKDRWIVAVTVDGKQIRRTAKDESDTVNILQALRRKYGLVKYSGNISLEDWYEEWLFETKYHTVRPRTVASHLGILNNHIRPYDIAKMPIAEITKMDVQKYFNQLAKDGRSRQRLETIRARLTTCLHEAEDYIEKNPMKGLKLPIAPDNSRDYSGDPDSLAMVQGNVFTSPQQQILLSALGNKWVTDPLIHFLMGTGLRIGEALALTRLDYDGSSIMVNKQLQRNPVFIDHELDHYVLEIVETKTEGSVRRIPLPTKMKALIDQRIREIKAMKEPYKDQGLLFPDEIGSPMDDKRPLRRLKALEKANGLPNVNIHGLRHTYATRLLELGEPIHSISKLLGHSSIELTQEIYAHVLESMKEKTVNRLDAIL